MTIKLYDDKAKELKDGQLFRIRKDSIEGRDVVILEPITLSNGVYGID